MRLRWLVGEGGEIGRKGEVFFRVGLPDSCLLLLDSDAMAIGLYTF